MLLALFSESEHEGKNLYWLHCESSKANYATQQWSSQRRCEKDEYERPLGVGQQTATLFFVAIASQRQNINLIRFLTQFDGYVTVGINSMLNRLRKFYLRKMIILSNRLYSFTAFQVRFPASVSNGPGKIQRAQED